MSDTESRSGANFLAVNTFHYHPNDISEIRRLAEQNPELAFKVIDQRDRESARTAASYRFGLLLAAALLAVTVVTFSCLAIFGGIFTMLVMIAGILIVALMVRVVLTGQWSETSWLGRLMDLLIGQLGGRP